MYFGDGDLALMKINNNCISETICPSQHRNEQSFFSRLTFDV